jgi:hypothetical protein
VNISSAWGVARYWGERAVDRVRSVELPQMPQINIGGGVTLKTLAIVAAAILGSYWLGSCQAGAAKDREWRTKIETGSREVMSILERNNVILTKADAEALAALELDNRMLMQQLEVLRAQRNEIPLSDACNACRIPSERLRER